MTSRWKKVWADFWGNKTRSILTILTITVGSFAVGFTNNLNLYMAESMESDFLSSSPSEAMVYAGSMDDQTVKMARTVPGVNAVEGQSTSGAKLIGPDGKKIQVRFTALTDPADLTVNTLKPASGQTAIAPLGDKQMLIDSSAEHTTRSGKRPSCEALALRAALSRDRGGYEIQIQSTVWSSPGSDGVAVCRRLGSRNVGRNI